MSFLFFPKSITNNNTYHSLILTDNRIKWIVEEQRQTKHE